MARYALNLPSELKSDAEQLAAHQGVSLNQFILWSVAEKVGALKQKGDDPQGNRIKSCHYLSIIDSIYWHFFKD